jgi:putative photosynthetic complex assembly protein
MSHDHSEKIPRGALIGAAGLISIAILATLAARVMGTPSMVPESSAVVARDLRFEDTADGAVDVYDTATKTTISTLTPGSNAFLRATLRGLASQRKREGIGDKIPFRLTAWADGRLTIDDTTTGRHVELEAFGETNAGAFAALLTPETGVRPETVSQ